VPTPSPWFPRTSRHHPLAGKGLPRPRSVGRNTYKFSQLPTSREDGTRRSGCLEPAKPSSPPASPSWDGTCSRAFRSRSQTKESSCKNTGRCRRRKASQASIFFTMRLYPCIQLAGFPLNLYNEPTNAGRDFKLAIRFTCQDTGFQDAPGHIMKPENPLAQTLPAESSF